MTKSGKSMFRIELDEEEKKVKAFTRSSKDLHDFVTQKTCILQLCDKQYFVSLCHLILGDTKGILNM